LQSVDCLAYDLGIDVGSADHPLKVFVRKAIGGADPALWTLFPAMHAVAFVTSKLWLESDFRAVLESHSNNCNVIALCISEIIVALKSSSANQDEKEIVNSIQFFMDISTALLLRVARDNKPHERILKGTLPSILIFLDKVVELTPYFTRDQLESILPYCLLRSMYRDLYDPAAVKGRKALQESTPAEEFN